MPEGTPTKRIDVDLFSPDTYLPGVPHEAFAKLRAESPVYWQDEASGSGYWALTKHRDVREVSKDTKRFSAARGSVLLADRSKKELENHQLMMTNMDPPQHNKVRGLVNKGFTPRFVRKLEPRIREFARGIVDRIAERGECEFVSEVAAELPLQVIAEMMGVPLEDRHRVYEWSNNCIAPDDPDYGSNPAQAKEAAARMYAYANDLAVERRRRPKDDLVSTLLQAELDGHKLSTMEFDLFFILLFVAGNETTRNVIAGGMKALCENPDQRARLIADPGLIPSAVEEMCRWISPLMQLRRTATEDTEIGGQKIRENDKLAMYYISANFDEEVFVDPYRFDVGRKPNDHLAFGIGQHYCLGAMLARLELKVIFEELLARLPDIEIDGPVPRIRSNFVNGIKRMPVRFTPA